MTGVGKGTARRARAGGGRRMAVGTLVAAVALAGCAGGGSRITKESASRSATTTAGSATSGRGDNFAKDDPDFDPELRSFYDQFLSTTDAHRTPANPAATHDSGLADLAAQPVVAAMDAWRATNESYGDGFQRVISITSTPNILDIAVDGALVTIRDCTEVVRRDRAGQASTTFATQVATVANHGGTYQVIAFDTVHDGRADTPGYGCIPRTMAGVASDTVKAMIDAFSAARAHPASGLPAALDALLASPLKEKLSAALSEQAAKNLAVTSPYDMKLTVLGIDPRALGKDVAVVSACITYPAGLGLRELDSGKVIREVLPAGAQSRLVYEVRPAGQGLGPTVFASVSEELSTRC